MTTVGRLPAGLWRVPLMLDTYSLLGNVGSAGTSVCRLLSCDRALLHRCSAAAIRWSLQGL